MRCGGIPPLLRLSDRCWTNVGEGIGSQWTLSPSTPSPSPPFNVRSATGAHNQELVGAPDQGAGSGGPPETESLAVGRPLGSIQQCSLPIKDTLHDSRTGYGITEFILIVLFFFEKFQWLMHEWAIWNIPFNYVGEFRPTMREIEPSCKEIKDT
jgi:hypothetical protein